MRRTLQTVLFLAAVPLCAAPVKVHGYITSLSSPQSFSIDEYCVTRPDSLAFEVEKGEFPDATFRPEDLRVGTEVEVEGDLDSATHELRASRIKAFLSDNLRVRRFAVIEHTATIERDGTGWSGLIRADGQRIRLDAQTRLTLKEGQSNRITPGMTIAYEGIRQADGSIRASKLEIFANAVAREEQKICREATPKINYDGELSVCGARYKLVADAEAQSYVQRIGSKLVPLLYQHDLSGGAARRPVFQFFLIQNPDFNAHAFPNGTVLINSGVFRVLTSEAQLAAVLGHEIAHATQEHAALELRHQKKGSPEFVREKGYAAGKGDPLVTGYSRALENQADRVGLEYMVSAGYDAREAAEVWKQVAKAASTGNSKGGGVVWNARDDATCRRSYLLAELRNNYSGVDFRSFVRDHEQFDVLAERFGNTAIAEHKQDVAIESGAIRPGMVLPGPAPASPKSASTSLGANFVTISSDPQGAEVFLGGRLIGTTPMNLPTGAVGLPFILTIHKAGYRNWTGQLVSAPGKTNLRVELFRVQ
jgi:hypothetical protein